MSLSLKKNKKLKYFYTIYTIVNDGDDDSRRDD